MSFVKTSFQCVIMRVAALAFILALTGCASISERTHAYLGSPKFPPTDPTRVKIVASEPSQPKDRLGEIMLHIEGNPSREASGEQAPKWGRQARRGCGFCGL
jgi:hypothetical protein